MSNKILLDLVEEPLSGTQIKQLIDCKVITYEELRNYSDLYKVLREKPLVILYQNRFGTGHWTCMFLRGNTVEVFDSYGIIPDNEIKWENSINKTPYLTILLNKMIDKYPNLNIEYNNYRFQELNQNVSTCGRWVILRLLLEDITIDEFKNFIDLSVKKYKNVLSEFKYKPKDVFVSLVIN